MKDPPPPPSWIRARKCHDGGTLPQIVAHRGHRAQQPENTLAAFRAALAAGADALETDVHLTRDGVAVLSHDADLARCFGAGPEAIVNRDWADLRALRTLRPPHLPLPRLVDLLAELAADPARDHVWVLLDIKADNDPDEALRRIAAAVASVPPSPRRAWRDRLLLGVWHAAFLAPCARHLPSYPLVHIGTNLCLASHFLRRHPHVALNTFVYALLAPALGPRLVRRARARARPVFAWTVDDPALVRWCAAHGLDALITDDPARARAVRDAWVAGGRRAPAPTWPALRSARRLLGGGGAGGAGGSRGEPGIRLRTWAYAVWVLALAWLFSPSSLWGVMRAGARRRARNRIAELPVGSAD